MKWVVWVDTEQKSVLGPCIWLTCKSNSSISVNWDLEYRLLANCCGQTGRVCVRPDVRGGIEAPVFVPLLAGKIFVFTNAAAER